MSMGVMSEQKKKEGKASAWKNSTHLEEKEERREDSLRRKGVRPQFTFPPPVPAFPTSIQFPAFPSTCHTCPHFYYPACLLPATCTRLCMDLGALVCIVI
jgi:hypothetical protein